MRAVADKVSALPAPRSRRRGEPLLLVRRSERSGICATGRVHSTRLFTIHCPLSILHLICTLPNGRVSAVLLTAHCLLLSVKRRHRAGGVLNYAIAAFAVRLGRHDHFAAAPFHFG